MEIMGLNPIAPSKSASDSGALLMGAWSSDYDAIPLHRKYSDKDEANRLCSERGASLRG